MNDNELEKLFVPEPFYPIFPFDKPVKVRITGEHNYVYEQDFNILLAKLKAREQRIVERDYLPKRDVLEAIEIVYKQAEETTADYTPDYYLGIGVMRDDLISRLGSEETQLANPITEEKK